MRDSSPSDKRRIGVQAGLILLASGVLGFAYNALNPAGISWFPHETPPAQPQLQAAANPYHVETISARLEPSSASAALPPAGKAGEATAVQTTWENARQLIERGEVVLVDSRPRLTYEAGHVLGAVNLPLNQVVSEIEKFSSAHPPPDSRLIVYCSNKDCPTSSNLAALLTQKYGYRDVRYVPGGYLEWLRTKTEEAR